MISIFYFCKKTQQVSARFNNYEKKTIKTIQIASTISVLFKITILVSISTS